jgi:DNA gyrase subunit B
MEPKLTTFRSLAEAVRRKPGMYIGRTVEANVCVFELISNSLQEHFEGRGNRITITIHDDESLSVTDEGGGISVAPHRELQIPFVELAMTTLHVWDNSRKRPHDLGLCGVGTKCVNAVSEWMRINTVWEGNEYQIGFARGEVSEPLIKLPKTERACGTSIRFKPDASIFRSISFNRDYLHDRFDQLAVLHPKLAIVLVDERPNVSGRPLVSLFHHPAGIRDYLRRNSHSRVRWEPVVLEGEVDGVEIALGFQFLDSGDPSVVSYVNSSPCVLGGTHVQGLLDGLTDRFNELAGKGSLFSPEDVRANLTAFVAVWLIDPKFGGATKDELINPEVETAVKELTTQGVKGWPPDDADWFIRWLEVRRVGLKREEKP